MNDFIPGQRWISDSELQMGLGTVLAVEHRTVTILFLATGQTRVYAKQTAPLTRINFSAGDVVRSHEGWTLKIDSIKDHNGLLTYIGTRQDGTSAILEEGKLDNLIQLNRPIDRLFTGQIDAGKWFDLRYETRLRLNDLANSDLQGLAGGRTSLIPHQLYIAHEVANRYAPRVLLADEVGLGKTIEAGLILHHQLLTERAHRVLIIVPETLMHQWLVEMIRRFNLRFSIFDEERCQAEQESNDGDNPFESEQLVICSLAFLTASPNRFEQALSAEWDLMVVDEAHHLLWSPAAVSIEYAIVEKLAARIKGVLLLTATPEQLGKSSHFARLRLLDAARFPDFDTFVEEEKHYAPVAQAVTELLSNNSVSDASLQVLHEFTAESDNQKLIAILTRSETSEEEKTLARTQLVDHLLDRHGTGRVLFRNTRVAVKGFPERKLNAYPLPNPTQYSAHFGENRASLSDNPARLLCPELCTETSKKSEIASWTTFDPRMPWLIAQLKTLRNGKVLVIAANANTALDIVDVLRIKAGIHAAVFHEGLSIFERDRAAAFFADSDNGSPVLVCSEIGSEGRNFQFAHDLILFDLPLNPDLLEQRIGRLDRIGQTETIQIHVPYLENSAQNVMFRWYHEGLGAFEHTCPAGHSVFMSIQEQLLEVLCNTESAQQKLEALIEKTKIIHHALNEDLQRGRDILLELNSCRLHIATRLRERAQSRDQDSALVDYMDLFFDAFGVDTEDHSSNAYIIRPSEHLQAGNFPGLNEDGMTITYDRNTALANENIHFITWEHPFVSTAMDHIVSSEFGNTSFSTVKYPSAKPGTMLLESVYVLESASSEGADAGRYLPPTTIRIAIDQFGKNHSATLTRAVVQDTSAPVPAETSMKIIRAHTSELRALIAKGEKLAQEQAPKIIGEARQHTHQNLHDEIDRLKALKQINPNVREEEIEFFETQLKTVNQMLDSASLRMDALRILIAV